MPEINLLQNESSDSVSFAPKKPKKIGLFFAIFLFILALLAYGFLFLQARQVEKKIGEAEQQISQVDARLETTKEERLKAISFQARLNNLHILLDVHLFWSKVFAELESFTYIPARITSLQASELTGIASITGTVPSYTDLAKLMLGFDQSENVSEVRYISSGPADEIGSSYSFSLEIVLDPNLFVKQE